MTLLVCLLVALGISFFLKFGLNKILSVMDATLEAQAQTAALSVAALIDPGWLRHAAPGDLPGLPGASALVRDLTRHAPLRIAEIQLVRYKDGRTAEHIYNSLDPDHPYYIRPGSIENVLDSPVYFQRDPGAFPTVFDHRPHELYVAGWAPIMTGPKQQQGLVLVLVNVGESVRIVRKATFLLLVVAAAFTLLAGVTTWRVGSTFEKVAVTDGLMGIVNHKHFKQRLEVECSRSGRYNIPLSLVMLDIDHFKKVNDTYGHAVGDQVLKALGKWCLETCRSTDLVARYGGEEIAVLLPHTSLSGAQEFAERLRVKVANEWVRDPDEDVTLRITVSLGVAQYERGMSAVDLVKRADAMLYESKRNGRNRVTCWTDDYAKPEVPVERG